MHRVLYVLSDDVCAREDNILWIYIILLVIDFSMYYYYYFL